MKLPVIKTVVESYSLAQLAAAENSLLNEEPLEINVEGDDEGEQLTHVLAAIAIKEAMKNEGINYAQALRQYTARVRTSIS
jgi:hypothetical protein